MKTMVKFPRTIMLVMCFVLTTCGVSGKISPALVKSLDLPPVHQNWQTYYASTEGLPNDHIFALKSDGKRLWVGTEEGLALFEDGSWKSWTEENGLPYNIIMGIDISEKTGDVWLATFGGGLVRFSGGRFDQFTQLNSGLVNDVLYGVAVSGDEIWTATAAGASTYNTVTGEWQIFNEKNSPMEEIWCYNVDAASEKVHIAVWGGGILEWDLNKKRWNAHRDPDREMEIDLYRDDGLIHDITTSVSYVDNTMWAASYFGLSRYDGRHWRGFMDHDSGLVSNFINLAVGINEDSCLVATDKGLSVLSDFKTDTWVTYKRENDSAQHWRAHVNRGSVVIAKFDTDLTLPNHFVITVAIHQGDLWIGTGHGLARSKSNKSHKTTE